MTCSVLERFLQESGVPFTVRDVLRDHQALMEFLATGFKTPPVTVIDGEAVWGYQPGRLEALLYDGLAESGH